jgi:hypothetical protein
MRRSLIISLWIGRGKSEREPTSPGHDGNSVLMGPDIPISAYEQIAPAAGAIEEEGRVQTKLLAPTMEQDRRIYRAPRVIVRARPPQRRPIARLPARQAAKAAPAKSPAKSSAIVRTVPIPTPRPSPYQRASATPKVDEPPYKLEPRPPDDAQASSAPSPARAQDLDSPASQIASEPEKPQIDPDQVATRMADIAASDMPTLNEPMPSAPVPVPLPKELDEQIPREVLVEQEVDAARRYLVRVACPGNTMNRQGEDLAIGRLHPVFAVRLAAGIQQARREGLPGACPFSTYRPPAFGVGGYSNKYDSMHAYGLAADMRGIGGPGSTHALTWWRVAHENGLYLPYGPYNHAEWNHTQLLHQKGQEFVASHPVRRTISGYAPIDLMAMWIAAGVDMLKVTPDQPSREAMPSPSARRGFDRTRRFRRRPLPVALQAANSQ